MKVVDGYIVEETFLIFGEDYARHPHALEHILRPLFEKNHFIWVETIGLRSPKFSLYDLKRIKEKLLKMIFKKSSQTQQRVLPQNFVIITPFMIPFNQFKLIRSFNQWSVKRCVGKVLKSDVQPILITSVPNACDYVGHFHESQKIYFCVDEFSLWPGLDYHLVQKMEQKLLTKVDKILATSDALAKTKTIAGQKTQVITHGVDFDFFHIPEKTQKNSVTKLCYFGLFDERFDQSLIIDLLSLCSQVEIHIIGNTVCSHTELSAHKNVIFHGKVDYSKLPSKVADMDMFILPYVRSELTENINPLKLKEYLATGRPVVATRLPEVVKLGEYLYLADDALEFKKIIDSYQSSALAHDAKKITDYVLNNETWRAKCQLLCVSLR